MSKETRDFIFIWSMITITVVGFSVGIYEVLKKYKIEPEPVEKLPAHHYVLKEKCFNGVIYYVYRDKGIAPKYNQNQKIEVCDVE
jgi:hypothetical protein